MVQRGNERSCVVFYVRKDININRKLYSTIPTMEKEKNMGANREAKLLLKQKKLHL
jgi:hypothetical protein